MQQGGNNRRPRYKPVMWAHGLNFRTYVDEEERWFGFGAVRNLKGLPPKNLLTPLAGYSRVGTARRLSGETANGRSKRATHTSAIGRCMGGTPLCRTTPLVPDRD